MSLEKSPVVPLEINRRDFNLAYPLRRVDLATPAELPSAFAEIQESSSGALLIQNDPMLGIQRSRICDFAVSHRLPTVFEAISKIPLGVLFTYGPDLMENARLPAGYVAKILNGANPADLTVQQPTKFVLIINLKTAKAIGLTIPQAILARTDEVLE